MIRSVDFAEHGEQRWLSAGFVDLQVNGYAGHDLNGLTLDPATVRALCQALLKVGVTTFLPTIITAPEARIIAALRTIREACAQYPEVAAMVAGIHVEGPHIAPRMVRAARIRRQTSVLLPSLSSLAGKRPRVGS